MICPCRSCRLENRCRAALTIYYMVPVIRFLYYVSGASAKVLRPQIFYLFCRYTLQRYITVEYGCR